MAFGGEEEVKAPSPGVSLGLLEASGDIGLGGPLRLRAGQFRVPYSRERLSNPGTLLFADRSINNLMFNVGRDVGAAVYGQRGDLVGTVGVFTGGGRSHQAPWLSSSRWHAGCLPSIRGAAGRGLPYPKPS